MSIRLLKDRTHKFECNDFFKVRFGEDVTHRQAHRATAAYYGLIDWMDQQFGRVIEKLEHLNVLDDFIIVFPVGSRRNARHERIMGETELF